MGLAVFLYIAYGILILTPFMVIWTVFVFRKFKSFTLVKQVVFFFLAGIFSFLLAWISILSHNEIFILAMVILNAVLLIVNTVRGILNLKSPQKTKNT